MRVSFLLGFLIPVFILVSCSRSVNSIIKNGYIKTTDNQVANTVFKDSNYQLDYGLSADKALNITYIGCGGFSLEKDGKIVLIDPFFSNPGFPLKSIGCIKTKSKTNVIDRIMPQVCDTSKSTITSVWVSHSHYDHLMDVPYIYNRYANTRNTKIYCSQSGKNMINGVDSIRSENVVVLDHISSDEDHFGKQFYVADSTVRITPILTEHAPHSQVAGRDIRFFQGESERKAKYNRSTDRSRASWWKLGQTFSFVIDYLDNDRKTYFRVYLQSSAADPGAGWVPSELKQEHPVNLAILGIASFEYVNSYPESLIEHLNPQRLILCHWEDFFLKYDRKKERIVRQTKLKEGIRRVNLVYPWKLNGQEKFSIPYPEVTIEIR